MIPLSFSLVPVLVLSLLDSLTLCVKAHREVEVYSLYSRLPVAAGFLHYSVTDGIQETYCM